MSRPEDIPQDVWDAAIRCAATALRNLPDDHGDVSFEIATIARAILAAKAEERAACALICDEEIERAKAFGPHHVPIIAGIRSAIRKRGEA